MLQNLQRELEGDGQALARLGADDLRLPELGLPADFVLNPESWPAYAAATVRCPAAASSFPA